MFSRLHTRSDVLREPIPQFFLPPPIVAHLRTAAI